MCRVVIPEGHRQYLPIVVLGKGDFGSDIVALKSGTTIVTPVDGTRAEHELPQPEGVPAFGQRLRVVGLSEDQSGVEVTVETDDGRRLTLHR